jgi:hypothetical protein
VEERKAELEIYQEVRDCIYSYSKKNDDFSIEEVLVGGMQALFSLLIEQLKGKDSEAVKHHIDVWELMSKFGGEKLREKLKEELNAD